MKLNLKFNSGNTSGIHNKSILALISRIWQKTHIILFFLVLIVAIAIGGYVWKQNVYSGEWNDEKKQEYINTQNQGVVFKEDNFNKVLDDISLRKEENLKEYIPVKDIFKPY